MVLEHLFKAKWAERRPLYSFAIGIIFTLIGFFTAKLLFRGDASFMVGIITILFAVLLTLPLISKLFDLEERIETKGKTNFFKEHEEIFDFFIYYFLGVFLTLFIISLATPNVMFDFGMDSGFSAESEIIKINTQVENGPPLPPDFGFSPEHGFEFVLLNNQVQKIFFNNLYIILICFILSILYGSGALFIILLNASVWAAKLAGLIRPKVEEVIFQSTPYIICNVGVAFFHMIPEIAGYILAAIAGGVLSKAISKEKLFGDKFMKVFKDSIILASLSLLLIFIAAIIEVHISKKLFINDICNSSQTTIIIITGVLVAAIIGFEIYRNQKLRHKKIRIKK